MNINCLFHVSLLCNLQTIIKLLSLSKHAKSLNHTYLWHLLCRRDYETLSVELNKHNFLKTYIACHDILKIKHQLSLEEDVNEIYDLQTLDLSWKGNPKIPMTYIPTSIAHLKNLTYINLSNNSIKNIPTELMQLTNLQELYICHNKLTTIPSEISQLTNLKNLDIGNNELISIPSEICQLSNLQYLWLSCNKLSSIPNYLYKLTKLELLHLVINQLTNIPSELTQLNNLRVLCLGNNNLEYIPDFSHLDLIHCDFPVKSQ